MKDLHKELNSLQQEAKAREEFKRTWVSDCGDGVYQRVCENASAEDFEKYVAELKTENPRAYTFERTVADNRFFGVQLNEGYIYVIYFPCMKQIRIQYATRGELVPPQLGEKDAYVGENTLTQITPTSIMGAPSGTGNFGMCYIFALGEGHFLVYDGMGDRHDDYERIYTALLAGTPEGQKPVIDAWIFTHIHFDHIAGITMLAQTHGSDIEVRNFVMNNAEPRRFGINVWSGVAACYNHWFPDIFETWSDAAVWKVHTGQRFRVGSAEVEVLFTQEETTYDEITEVNNTSLFTRVFFAGKSFAMPADTQTEKECQMIHDLYGSYLKSDYYQMAHHGWDTYALSFFYDIDPENVLWPVNNRHWNNPKLWEWPASAAVAEDIKSGRRKFYIAIGEDAVIKL